MPASIGAIGRQTELSTVDPSNPVDDAAQPRRRLTPDNVTSPYYPYWRTGVPLRYSESLGARTFAWPDMWVEIPETSLTFEDPADTTNTDRVLSITCVDLLTRFNRAPRFISNIGAHVLSLPSLLAYYPLGEPDGAKNALPAVGVDLPPLPARMFGGDFGPAADRTVFFGAGDVPPGDDSSSCRFTWTTLGDSGLLGGNAGGPIVAMLAEPVTISTGQFVTIMAWCQLELLPLPITALQEIISFQSSSGGGFGVLNLSVDFGTAAPVAPGPWHVAFANATWGSNVAQSGAAAVGRIAFVGARMQLGATQELWLDDTITTATFGGSPPASMTFDWMRIGAGWNGSISHVQVYVGSDAPTHADFLAQRELGLNGFAGQTVDERIRTIANFTGLVNDPLHGADHAGGRLDLEESDSVMPKAAFAGRRPGELAQEAAATGGGLLFTRDHQLVYQDRKHRFNL